MNVTGRWKIKEAEMFSVTDSGVNDVRKTVEEIMGKRRTVGSGMTAAKKARFF